MRRPRTARLGMFHRSHHPHRAILATAAALAAALMSAAAPASAAHTNSAASAATAHSTTATITNTAARTAAARTAITTATSANLLVDPGAESAAQCSTANGEDGMTVPGWTITSGEPNVVCYGASGGFPTASSPGSPTRGKGFFAGGATGNSGLSQTVDVSAAASLIDAGGVPVNLSGWIGGYSSQNDRAGVTATFQSASGGSLGTVAIAPVTNTDRGNTTEFLDKAVAGTLPAGTRSIKVDLAFTWTAGGTTDGYIDDLALTIGASLPTPALTAPVSTVPGFDHVFVIYMENEDYGNIIGSSSAPYINSLMPSGTTLTQSYATTHPSDPNYLALAAGGLYGVYANSINTSVVNAPSLGNSVENAGKTWKSYIQNMNGNCDTTAHGNYEDDDTPFYYFAEMKNNPSYCQAHWQPLTSMMSDLGSAATTPNFVWFAADSCYDMEGCGISAGDTWLSQTLPSLFNSPAWTTQRSLLVLTWDEGAVKSFGPGYPNRVPTILLGSQGSVKAGYQSSQRTDQFGLLRTVDKALGLAPLTNNDAYAATVNDAWTTTSTGGNDFSMSDAPASASVNQGSSTTSTISTSVVSGTAENVTLSASGLPAGATATFNPATVTAGGSSTMTIQTSATTPAGSSTVTVTGTAASATHTAPFTLTVNGTGTGGPIVSGGIYNITQGSQVIDDPASSQTAGTQLIVYQPNGGYANQKWTFTANADGTYSIKNGTSGLCIDDSGSSNLAGSKIVQWTCASGAGEEWTVAASGSSYNLVSKQSGLVITASGTANLSTLTQQANSNTALQLWNFTKVG